VFGEARLVELSRTYRHASPDELVTAIINTLQEWAKGMELVDDRTVIALRVLPQ
jgi:serine phosphatase RsbU (regulator of sigma subunit)